MTKFLWFVVLIFTLALVTAMPGWVETWGFKNPPAVNDEFNHFNGFQMLVNGKGEIAPPPFHVGRISIENGVLGLHVDYDGDYQNREEIIRPGAPGSDLYNNVFGLQRTQFLPTLTENVELEVAMRIPAESVKEVHGSGGFWLNDAADFDNRGYLRDGGFVGAVGVSFTGYESDKLVNGFKFMYAKGKWPLCIKNIEGIDPTQWHTYKIIWIKTLFGHRYELYVDDSYITSCHIAFLGFGPSNGQIWRDNFLIGSWVSFGHQNFDETQSIEFDYWRIKAVEK